MRKDADEIESFFDGEIEKLDTEFLEKIKAVKTQDEAKVLENAYKQRSAKLLEAYNREYGVFLDAEKRSSKGVDFTKKEKDTGTQNEDEDKDQLDMSKPFVARQVNLKPTFRDSMRLRWDLFKFRLDVRVRNFDRNYVPAFFIIFLYKSRIVFRGARLYFLNKASKTKEGLINNLANFWSGTKDFSKKVASASKTTFMFIANIFNSIFRRKKSKAGKEKKDEG